jgi:hypothetical protein
LSSDGDGGAEKCCSEEDFFGWHAPIVMASQDEPG